MKKYRSFNRRNNRKVAKWLATFLVVVSLTWRPTAAAAVTATSSPDRVTGDLETTPDSQDGIFGDMDGDNNGRISIDEIREFVVDTGGHALDDNKEIQNAVDNVLFALDENEDKVILKKDFNKYWKTLASVLTTDEVVAWAQHAQQLPPYIVAKLSENHVTGYDFPELLANEGHLLEVDLNITKVSIKKRIMRGMRMILLGMSQAPPAPNGVSTISKSCSEILIKWNNAVESNLDFPIHKYIIQRHGTRRHAASTHKEKNWYLWEFLNETSNASRNTNAEALPRLSASSELSHYSALHTAASWITVFEGTGQDSFFEDNNLERETNYRYRIISWNAVGHSNYVYIDIATVASPCDSSQFQDSDFFSSLSFLFTSADLLYSYVRGILVSIVLIIFPLSPPGFKVCLLDMFIKLSTFLSPWVSFFSEVTNNLQQKKAYFEAKRDKSSLAYSGLRKINSRDGFNSDGSDHNGSSGIGRTVSDNSLGGNNSDDDTTNYRKYCTICKKKLGFGFKVARCRHVCKFCGNPFCKDCGETTHAGIFMCKVPSTCTCKKCLTKLEMTKTVAKENGIVGIALNIFKKRLKSRRSRSEFQDLVNATDENGTTQCENVQSQKKSKNRDSVEGRPPRPIRRESSDGSVKA